MLWVLVSRFKPVLASNCKILVEQLIRHRKWLSMREVVIYIECGRQILEAMSFHVWSHSNDPIATMTCRPTDCLRELHSIGSSITNLLGKA